LPTEVHRLGQGYALEVLPSGDASIVRVTRNGDEVAQLAVIPTAHGALQLVVERGDHKLVDLTLTEGPGVEGFFC
jgi:hypothetical protein